MKNSLTIVSRGAGYENRRTSKDYVFVMVFAWSRDLDLAHSNKMVIRE